MKYSMTVGSDNCGCSVKITTEYSVTGEYWGIDQVEVVRHCTEHRG